MYCQNVTWTLYNSVAHTILIILYIQQFHLAIASLPSPSPRDRHTNNAYKTRIKPMYWSRSSAHLYIANGCWANPSWDEPRQNVTGAIHNNRRRRHINPTHNQTDNLNYTAFFFILFTFNIGVYGVFFIFSFSFTATMLINLCPELIRQINEASGWDNYYRLILISCS